MPEDTKDTILLNISERESIRNLICDQEAATLKIELYMRRILVANRTDPNNDYALSEDLTSLIKTPKPQEGSSLS